MAVAVDNRGMPTADPADARDGDGLGSATESAGILWGVGAVSRRLGVATATLRTWDRRYGLGPSERTSGGHRRYSERDVATVARMNQFIAEGVPSAQAARVARAGQVAPEPDRPAPAEAAGRAVQLTVNAMMRATQDLDAATLTAMVGQVLDHRGVLDGWTTVMAPFLVTVGQQWEIGQLGIATEHLASECISTELRQRVRQTGEHRPVNAPVVLASAADDQHALPLAAVAAGLAERHISARMLGARTPVSALTDAVDRICPRVVFIWSSLTATGLVPSLAGVEGLDPKLVLLLGGPGWQPTGDPTESAASVERVASLDGTVNRIAELVA